MLVFNKSSLENDLMCSSALVAVHEGSGKVKFQMWTGNGFKQVTPFMEGDRAMVRKMVIEAADKYAAEKKITPRDCAKDG